MTRPRRISYTLKKRAIVINLEEVVIGDQVTIRDRSGNLVIGQVEGVADQRWVTAFGTKIAFARQGRNDKWMPAKGVSVAAHLPAMFPAQL